MTPKFSNCSISPEEWEVHMEALREYQRNGSIAINQIKEIHSWKETVLGIKDNTAHLAKLDILEDIKEGLMGPATGRKQVPISIFLTVVGFMGIILLIVLVGTTEKTIDVGWNHVRIESKK